MPRIRTRLIRNLRRGRAQRLLAGATAVSALPLGAEIYVNHYSGSFGNKWMWTPVFLSPALAGAGMAGVVFEGAAAPLLPANASLSLLDGLAGTFFHLRGAYRKPGGFREATYNLVTGPPALAPGALAMVGGMGLTAAIVRRER